VYLERELRQLLENVRHDENIQLGTSGSSVAKIQKNM
jgi:hypothetical protein